MNSDKILYSENAELCILVGYRILW